MYKQMIKVLIILLSLFLLSGCWDSKGIREKNIVTTVIVDKTDIGYAFYAEIPISSSSQGSEGDSQNTEKNFYLRSEGKTFEEARLDIDKKSSKAIYLGAVQSVIMTQKMAESGFEEYFLRMRQTPDYRKTLKVLVTKEKPEDLLKAHTGNEDLLGLDLEDLLQASIRLGQTVVLTLTEILERLNSPNPTYYVPVINMDDNQETEISEYAVFDHDKAIGYIPIQEGKGLAIINSDKPILHQTIQFQNNQYSIEIRFSKRKRIADYQQGQIDFQIHYHCKATLLYMQKSEPFTEQIKEGLSQELTKFLKKTLSETISKSQEEHGLDYMGFYTCFRIKYPEIAKKMNWKNEYPKAKFHIDVKISLSVSGNVDYNPKDI